MLQLRNSKLHLRFKTKEDYFILKVHRVKERCMAMDALKILLFKMGSQMNSRWLVKYKNNNSLREEVRDKRWLYKYSVKEFSIRTNIFRVNIYVQIKGSLIWLKPVVYFKGFKAFENEIFFECKSFIVNSLRTLLTFLGFFS
jgi:hypothetical protein